MSTSRDIVILVWVRFQFYDCPLLKIIYIICKTNTNTQYTRKDDNQLNIIKDKTYKMII